MIIILEGPRGSGKTYLAKELATRLTQMGLDAEYWKANRSDGVPSTGMMAAIHKMASEPSKIWIVDRFHLTEAVMSAHFKRVPLERLSITTAVLWNMLRDADAVVYIVLADPSIICERLEHREDATRKFDMDPLLADHIWRIVAATTPTFLAENDLPIDAELIISNMITAVAERQRAIAAESRS